MAQTITIRAEKLVVKKDNITILRELTFEVPAGTITGLIGPSGSGKTTLMRAIVGVQSITNGTLAILGRPAGSYELRRRIGYVSQVTAIYEDLTVLQNVRYFATLVHANRSQADEVIDLVRLNPQRNQVAQSLSGGEKARVSLAIALLGNPDLLVLDEPTVGLDPLLRRELWQLFAELAAKGKTLLISSHVMDEAEKCHDLLLMRSGELLWQDTRESLLRSTNTQSVESAFIAIIPKQEAA